MLHEYLYVQEVLLTKLDKICKYCINVAIDIESFHNILMYIHVGKTDLTPSPQRQRSKVSIPDVFQNQTSPSKHKCFRIMSLML